MNGLTIIETEQFEQIKKDLSDLKELFSQAIAEIKDAKSPYMTEQQVMEFTGMSRTTIYRNRDQIGFSRPAGTNRFKRSDVVNFMNQYYHKKQLTP